MTDDRSREEKRADARYRSWNDGRLDDLADQVRIVAALGTMVARHDSKIDQSEDDRIEMRSTLEKLESRMARDIARVAKECEDFHTEYRQDREAAKTGSRGMVVAMVGGSFGVLAAIVSAAAVLIGAK
ncbi:MAG: hypothetical protein H0W36_02605 [Gemmatimonadetes bacterium]|nr:hypothetical protein [Gemmatimonadota bacterium]